MGVGGLGRGGGGVTLSLCNTYGPWRSPRCHFNSNSVQLHESFHSAFQFLVLEAVQAPYDERAD